MRASASRGVKRPIRSGLRPVRRVGKWERLTPTGGLFHGSSLKELGEKLDIQHVAASLSDGWRRYVELFGEPPHGTIKQFLALLEFSSMDGWRVQSKCRCGGTVLICRHCAVQKSSGVKETKE